MEQKKTGSAEAGPKGSDGPEADCSVTDQAGPGGPVLDPALNTIPRNVASVHLIAVCGTAMGALAAVLREKGICVTGSDANVYPPMSTFLAGKKIPVTEGFSADNPAYGPDLVVIGNAVRRDNPEVATVARKRIPYCSMPQAVNRFLVEDRKAVVVTGTHGKTTTSAMIAWLLFEGGMDPSFLIGGILGNFHSNYRTGSGGWAVLEGDEYDTAFFDKKAKFFHYPPNTAVVTSVEFDHADIFDNLAHIRTAFDEYLSGMDPGARLIAFDGDETVRGLVAGRNVHIEMYGMDGTAMWQIGKHWPDFPYNGFEVIRDGRLFGRFRMKMPGAHNRWNALAAVALAAGAGLPVDDIRRGLETFSGIRRRQEIRGVKNGVLVLDDFAHHPSAVKHTVAAVREFYPDAGLFAVFEPRTNTSMRSVFQSVYPGCFSGADTICIRKPPLLDKIPKDKRFSSQQLVEDLADRGADAHFFRDTEGIISFIAGRARPGDVVLVMSNGGFDNIHERLLTAL